MKKILLVLSALLLSAALWLIGSGFSVRTGVYIADGFSVSEDGCEMTFTAVNASSMGFIRGFRDEGGEGRHNLKFYSAWGGLNSSLGAKSQFTLRLRPEDREICLYRGKSGYEAVLEKDSASGEWIRVR